MAKFKVGDKVVGNKEASEHYVITKAGWVGTVTEFWGDGMYVTGDGLYDRAWVNPAYFDLASKTKVESKKKVYLQYDGKTTKAALVAGGKNGHLIGSGETNCSPADDYDTVIGTLYAVLRLAENMGYDTDKLYGEYKSCGKKAKKKKKEKKSSKKEKLGAKTTKTEYVFHDGKLVTDKAEQEKIKEYCRKKIELLEGPNFDEDIFENAWKATRKWFNF